MGKEVICTVEDCSDVVKMIPQHMIGNTRGTYYCHGCKLDVTYLTDKGYGNYHRCRHYHEICSNCYQKAIRDQKTGKEACIEWLNESPVPGLLILSCVGFFSIFG